MARKKLSKNQRIIQQQKQRITTAIKRLEKEGYSIDFEMPIVPSRITEKTIAQFRSITPKYLRAKSTRIEVETEPPITSRLDDEIAERKKQLQEMQEYVSNLSTESSIYSSSVATLELMRTELDFLEQKRLSEQPEYAEKFSQRNMVYGELTFRITEISEQNSFIEAYLKDMLQSEINDYGEEAVLRSIAELPEEEVEKTERVLRYATKTEHKAKQLMKMVGMIRGTMLTSAEMRKITSLMEASNFENDWE